MTITKVTARTPILQKDLFTVFEDSIELPNGEKRTYHSVKRSNAITVIPVTADNEIYLIKQYRHMYEKWMFEAVAGMVDSGEDPLTSAQRELKEEIGIEAKNWTQLGVTNAAGSVVTWDQYIYLATELTVGIAQLESSEQIELIKMPFEQAVEMVMNGEITISASIIGILMAQEYLNKQSHV